MDDQVQEADPSPPAPIVKLTLHGAGLSFERDLPQETALAVINVVMGGQTTPRTSPIVAHPPAGRGTSQSLREYMAEVEASRNPEKILAIGAYLIASGQEGFTRDQVKSQFQSAGEPVPGNYPRDFTLTVAAGWIAERPGSPGQYYVTNTGQKALDERFPKDTRRSITRARQPRRRGRPKKNETAAE